MSTKSSNFVQPAIPKFDGHYDHWAMLMENFLRSKEYWHLVEAGIPTIDDGVQSAEAERKSIEDHKIKDLKVKSYLFQSIERSNMETILDKGSSKSIWDSMKQNLVSGKIIVSKDVNFEEDKGWNWGRTAEEVKRDMLACEADSNQDTTTSISSDSSNKDTPVLAKRRIRKVPNYLQDYETGEELFEDENYFAMFTSHEDPNSFEEAERYEK
ncbi:hypothetical protein KIW84_070286 [Lathyrus oleraceus]|uniref:Retrovirus-related Pol polyprotein from transposon TNT 1-94 n=1 Tax=Pisum sativum TaxID=3888 RepID=A0A9D4VFX2_PEA|nr:hypothetical protein KIW84_070286 [Pisum sativum]